MIVSILLPGCLEALFQFLDGFFLILNVFFQKFTLPAILVHCGRFAVEGRFQFAHFGGKSFLLCDQIINLLSVFFLAVYANFRPDVHSHSFSTSTL
jgi:hypothetical protein